MNTAKIKRIGTGVVLVLSSLILFGAGAQAQWRTETYSMKGGWNAIYLHGDASHATPDEHFAAGDATNLLEVWRWNPNPDQIQFTDSPLIPSAGTPEWSVWIRDQPAQSDLSNLTARSAYLVKCAGSESDSYLVPIVQRPVPPSATWLRSGANLLGFPSKLNGSYPTFSNYFETFPAAIAANTKIYKYVGGDFGPANPIQVFSPAVEPLDRHQAYWFESAVVGNFYAPIEISLTNQDGLDFGRTGSAITARLRNRTATTVTITMAPAPSDAAPAGQTVIEGDVPLTLRTFNAVDLTWTETPITAPFDQVHRTAGYGGSTLWHRPRLHGWR